jgi:hypothetical protein
VLIPAQKKVGVYLHIGTATDPNNLKKKKKERKGGGVINMLVACVAERLR